MAAPGMARVARATEWTEFKPRNNFHGGSGGRAGPKRQAQLGKARPSPPDFACLLGGEEKSDDRKSRSSLCLDNPILPSLAHSLPL